MTELTQDLTLIECILLDEERPDYIEVSKQQNFVYILLSRESYKYDKLSERIYSVFEVLELYCPEFLQKYSFIVETFSSEELSGLFEFYKR